MERVRVLVVDHSAEDRRRALAAGFDQHLAKPIDRVALAEAVARAVRESAA